ncbi:MAG: GTPase Era [Acidimicrobiales bacterium]
MTYRSGFAAVVGRPNVGKSSLVNRILGTKVTITSSRPNTTRRPVRGVLHRPGMQAVFVDTPGLHRPRSALGRRLNEHVGEALDDLDVVLALVDATEPIGPGDRLVLSRAAQAIVHADAQPTSAGKTTDAHPSSRMLVVVNKVDAAAPGAVLERLSSTQRVLEEAGCDDGVEFFPVSARTGQGVTALVDAVLDCLPEGPPYFPDDMMSDSPEAFWVAELVREQLLARVRDELPHSIACRVVEWRWPYVEVDIIVERDSQKGIVIGDGGSVLKDVGTAVRTQLPEGAYIELRVRVEKHWQQRADIIERFGY